MTPADDPPEPPKKRVREPASTGAPKAGARRPTSPARRREPRPQEPKRQAEPAATGTPQRIASPFPRSLLDEDVVRVVRKLRQEGHDAYLVGGCVRDLLLGKAPKDFDVATSARPEVARRVFRNSRVIGRRFRLVHVLFRGQKVIEVATFRRAPEADESRADLPIRDDNTYGTIEEDALRRDFTINALFYDPEDESIIDYCGGMLDVERHAVRTIGDPFVRFREDPIRMLRAVKFAAKLDLGICPDEVDAILFTRESLRLSAKPRLFEEILRLLRGGAARRAVHLAWELGLLHVLLPELASVLDDVGDDDAPHTRIFRLLAELDAEARTRGAPLDDVELFALLLLEPALEACEGEEDRKAALAAFLEPIAQRFAVPRRVTDGVQRVLELVPRLESPRAKAPPRDRELFERARLVTKLRALARGDARLAERLGIQLDPPRARDVT